MKCTESMDCINKMISLITVWLCLAIILFIGQKAYSASFKCGKSFVNTGDSVSTVRHKCGKPVWKDVTSSHGSHNKYESWNYNYLKRGNGTLNFRNGRLRSIETEIR